MECKNCGGRGFHEVHGTLRNRFRCLSCGFEFEGMGTGLAILVSVAAFTLGAIRAHSPELVDLGGQH